MYYTTSNKDVLPGQVLNFLINLPLHTGVKLYNKQCEKSFLQFMKVTFSINCGNTHKRNNWNAIISYVQLTWVFVNQCLMMQLKEDSRNLFDVYCLLQPELEYLQYIMENWDSKRTCRNLMVNSI